MTAVIGRWWLISLYDIRENIVNRQPQILVNGGQFHFYRATKAGSFPSRLRLRFRPFYITQQLAVAHGFL